MRQDRISIVKQRLIDGGRSIINPYLFKRIIYAILSVWAVTTLVFLMTHILPGSAANIILGSTQTPERVEQLEQTLGLNRPLYIQYIDWLAGIVTGQWGQSLISDQPVAEIIIPRLIRSLQLAVVATLLTICTGIPLGVLAAARRNERVDHMISFITYIGLSLPTFVSGTLLLLFLTSKLSLFPSGGYVPLKEGIIPWFHHILLPALSLTLFLQAYVLRQIRVSMIEELQATYTRTAQLKGVNNLQILFRHVLPNALLPTITILAINFGWLLGSLVIVEEIFSYPGLGQMVVDAISSRDLPLIEFGIIVITTGYILANLIADIVYSLLDPTIEFGE